MHNKQSPFQLMNLMQKKYILVFLLYTGCYAHWGNPVSPTPEQLHTQIVEACQRHDLYAARHLADRLAQHPKQAHRAVREARSLDQQSNPCALFYHSPNSR